MLLGLKKEGAGLKELFIKGEKNTPEVKMNPKDGMISIKGISVPEDAKSFYLPVYNWLLDYLENPCKSTELHVALHYFNTTTSSILLNIFKQVDKIPNAKIIWHYEDDDMDMEEVGKDYKMLIGGKFELKALSS